jgi:hypothetical protein
MHKELEKWHRLVAYLQEITTMTGKTFGVSQILSISHEIFIKIMSIYTLFILIPDTLAQEKEKPYLLFLYGGTITTFSYMTRAFQRCFVSQMIETQVAILI